MHYYIIHQTSSATALYDEQIKSLSAFVQGSAIICTRELLTSVRGPSQERDRLGLIILKNGTCLRCHLTQPGFFLKESSHTVIGEK